MPACFAFYWVVILMCRVRLGCVHHVLWREICCGGLILKESLEWRTTDKVKRVWVQNARLLLLHTNSYAVVQDNTPILCLSDSSCAPHKKQQISVSQDISAVTAVTLQPDTFFLGSVTCSSLPALFHAGTLKHNLLFFFYRPLHITAQQYFFAPTPRLWAGEIF